MTAALMHSVWNSFGQNNFTGTATTHTLDATNDGWGAAFEAESADAITHIGFRYGVRTGTPPTFVAALESLAATGLPDGTDIGGGSPTAKTFTPPADATWDGTFQWIQLTNAFTPTRGQKLCMTVRHSSGTIDGTNNSTITRAIAANWSHDGFPYNLILTAGTWTKPSTNLSFGYRTANGRYGHLQTGLTNKDATTLTHRVAMYFTLPAGHGDTFKLAGATIEGFLGTATNTILFGLWNAAGTALSSRQYDNDHVRNPGNAGCFQFLFNDVTLPTLTYGTKYYVGFEKDSAGADPRLRVQQLQEAADRSSFPNGVNRGYSAWNGSAWSDDDTVMPMIELLFSDITEPASGGFVGGGGNKRGNMQ